MLTQSQINKIKKYASTDSKIAAIYLFGSQVKDKTQKRSDVDLGILFYNDIDGFERIDMETELSNLIEMDVDLIDMKKANPLLRHQVYKYGVEIYLREKNYSARFRASSIQEYLDTLYLHEKRMEIMYGR